MHFRKKMTRINSRFHNKKLLLEVLEKRGANARQCWRTYLNDRTNEKMTFLQFNSPDVRQEFNYFKRIEFGQNVAKKLHRIKKQRRYTKLERQGKPCSDYEFDDPVSPILLPQLSFKSNILNVEGNDFIRMLSIGAEVDIQLTQFQTLYLLEGQSPSMQVSQVEPESPQPEKVYSSPPSSLADPNDTPPEMSYSQMDAYLDFDFGSSIESQVEVSAEPQIEHRVEVSIENKTNFSKERMVEPPIKVLVLVHHCPPIPDDLIRRFARVNSNLMKLGMASKCLINPPLKREIDSFLTTVDETYFQKSPQLHFGHVFDMKMPIPVFETIERYSSTLLERTKPETLDGFKPAKPGAQLIAEMEDIVSRIKIDPESMIPPSKAKNSEGM